MTQNEGAALKLQRREDMLNFRKWLLKSKVGSETLMPRWSQSQVHQAAFAHSMAVRTRYVNQKQIEVTRTA